MQLTHGSCKRIVGLFLCFLIPVECRYHGKEQGNTITHGSVNAGYGYRSQKNGIWQSQLVVVAPLSILLGCCEEFLSLGRILLLHCGVAYLACEEVLEEIPVRSLAVEGERIFTTGFSIGVVTPQMPVTALYRASFFGLVPDPYRP